MSEMTDSREKNSVETNALETRIQSQTNQKIDLAKWIGDNLKLNRHDKILELCCGTGGQTSIFAREVDQGVIVCSDINPESIEINRRKLLNERIRYIESDLDSLPKLLDENFDLIFCGYGFYYSERPKALFHQLLPHLNTEGRFVLVGPVLGNNSELYALVEALKLDIPQPVIESSEHFMIDMQRMFLSSLDDVMLKRVKNEVTFGSADKLLQYWQKTTFYVPGFDAKFLELSSEFFSERFVLTKSIAFLEGKKGGA
jgi:ubiquinone/menaquinone biosynthesis C-methylase UbiE